MRVNIIFFAHKHKTESYTLLYLLY